MKKASVSPEQGGLAAGEYSVVKKVVEHHATYHLRDSPRKMGLGVRDSFQFSRCGVNDFAMGYDITKTPGQ